ncbi:hypothetical protein [Bathymodiolus japonicus methanotrophic gill symbiont]|uniref:hypothetical protein n=1 Tax=Bathymodiolus japonicus methanotrophic gill symbiont TaxID=113269 RepID=UPI001C8E0A93|nr:hypothetical protein [Bathymodiolus japonicus methanotrophic gill symbiont]
MKEQDLEQSIIQDCMKQKIVREFLSILLKQVTPHYKGQNPDFIIACHNKRAVVDTITEIINNNAPSEYLKFLNEEAIKDYDRRISK